MTMVRNSVAFSILLTATVMALSAPVVAQEETHGTDFSTVDMYYALGRAYQAKSAFNDAIKTYRKALQIRQDPKFYYAIGLCHGAQGAYASALGYLTEAESLAQADQRLLKMAYHAHACTLVIRAIHEQFDEKNLTAAAADYEAALKYEDNPTTHANLAAVLQQLGRSEAATQEYEKSGSHGTRPRREFEGDILRPDGGLLVNPG